MDAGENSQVNPFRTCDENGKPVQFRLSTPEASRAVHQYLEQEDAKDAVRRGNIQRMYDMWLPYPKEEQVRNGKRANTNINAGGLFGTIKSMVAVIQDLALDTIPLVEMRPARPAQAGPDAARKAAIYAEGFSNTLRDGRRFLPCLAHMVKESSLFGLGPVMFRAQLDYQPVPLRRGQLKFPPNTKALSSDAEFLTVEHDLDAAYLFRLFDDPKHSAAEGWNLDEVKRFLVATFVKLAPTESTPGAVMGNSAIESAIALWRQNRGVDTNQFQTLNVVSDFVREVSGKRGISHSIRVAAATQREIAGEDPLNRGEEKFLFRKADAYENFDQCLIWLPASVDEFQARSLRGVASMLYPAEDVANKMLCSTVDGALAAMSITLVNKVPNSREVSITTSGAYTVFGPDLSYPQGAQSIPNFQQLVGIRELVQSATYNNALGIRGAAAAPERVYTGADRKSQAQVELEAEAAAKVDRAGYIMRTTVFDLIFRESFRRFAKLVELPEEGRTAYPEVQAFIDWCEGQGIDYDTLKADLSEFKVFMCRDLVLGGGASKAAALMGMLDRLGGNFDEQGRINATRDIVYLTLGRVAADRYRPENDRSSLPSDSASHATIENNMMLSGMPTLVGIDQLHWTHIPVHGQPIEQIIQSFQQGQTQDPQRDLDILSAVTDHIREHLQYGRTQTGMEGTAKAIEANLRSLSPVIKGLTMAAATIEKERAAEEAKQQAELEKLQKAASDAELQPKLAKVQADKEVAMLEVNAKHEARMADIANRGTAAAMLAQAKAEAVPPAVTKVSGTLAGLQQGMKISSGNEPTLGAFGEPPRREGALAPLFSDEDLAGQ